MNEINNYSILQLKTEFCFPLSNLIHNKVISCVNYHFFYSIVAILSGDRKKLNYMFEIFNSTFKIQ